MIVVITDTGKGNHPKKVPSKKKGSNGAETSGVFLRELVEQGCQAASVCNEIIFFSRNRILFEVFFEGFQSSSKAERDRER